jgi:hypothetical protein
MGIIVIVLGALDVVSAIGVLLHKSWARWTAIVLGVLGTLLGLFVVWVATEPPLDAGMVIFGVIWVGAHVLAVIGMAAGGRHFEPARPY